MRAVFEKISVGQQSSFAYTMREDRRFDFNWHFHAEFELTLIVHSSGRRFVGDHIGDYTDGDLVLLAPNLPHTWHSDATEPGDVFASPPAGLAAPAGLPPRGRHRAVVIQFEPQFLGQGFFDRPELLGVARLLTKAARGIQFVGPTRDELGERIMQLGRVPSLGRLMGLVDILDLMSQSPHGMLLASAAYEPALQHVGRHRFDEVCTFLNEHFTDPVCLEDAAAIAELAPSAFCRFFKKATGRTLTGYLNELRVTRACQLLSVTQLPVGDICFEAGFGNLSNFNRRFLEHKGVTPRQFRQELYGRPDRRRVVERG